MMVINATNETFKREVSEGTVLVKFHASWCGPCKTLAPVVDEFAAENQELVKVVGVDADECGDIAMEYGVMSIPTLIVFKNGEMVKKGVGLHNKEQLKSLVE